MKFFDNIEDIENCLKYIHNIDIKRIIQLLINIYQDECECNEGSLTFSDLCVIFNVLWSLDYDKSNIKK